MTARWTLIALLALAGWGCGSTRAAPPDAPAPAPEAVAALDTTVTTPAPARPTGRYTGHFTYDWEKQVFRPCGGREEWWAWGMPAELQKRWGQRTWVVVEGELSGRGEFGHMGRYRRQIRVTSVIRQEPGEGRGCSSSAVA
jgi:hypothetical protein